MNSRLCIVVAGLLGLYPVGGVAWDYLQYAIGLAQLGHDVYYHEDTWSWPYHPLEKTHTSDGSYSAKYIKDFFSRYAPDLSEKWHYLHLHKQSFGMSQGAFDEVARKADLFLNVSGACMIPNNLSPQCVKIFLDTDPGYNQIMLSERLDWSENVDRWYRSVAEHDKYFTYAENIHDENCLIPKLSFKWNTTRMPIILDLWRASDTHKLAAGAPWTTIMTWDGFKGKLIYKGVEYKSKSAEFDKLIYLPSLTVYPLKVAVGGLKTPFKCLSKFGWSSIARFFSFITRVRTFNRLTRHGWQVVDGPSISLTASQYKKFILASRGEISPAKNVYVAMRTGWFSCRSACYLAASRPVVVQDTGFSSILPVGKGILPFCTLEEAANAILEIEANYSRHVKAAREIAEAFFDSDKVLSKLINDALIDD
jgi:hypothetical protein